MKLSFKKVIRQIHLWLGLVTGVVVLNTGLTGAIYTFHEEIKDLNEPWRTVTEQSQPLVLPSVLLDSAKVHGPEAQPTGITYDGSRKAAAVGFISMEKDELRFSVVFLNPYTGTFIARQDPIGYGNFDFLHFIEQGHRTLWLPEQTGKTVVGISTLLFLVISLSGLILWWPKNWNKHHRQKALTIKRGTPIQRKILDLHNVLGFYTLVIAIVFAITGLVWSFSWFANGVYFMTSGGQSKTEHIHPHSNTINQPLSSKDSVPAIDRAFVLTLQQEPEHQRLYIDPAINDPEASIEIVVGLIEGKYYKHNEYFYDKYTLEPLHTDDDFYDGASFADKLDKMNYDIHTGAILGFPGKILAFFASLIIASLPVTGFLLWLKSRR